MNWERLGRRVGRRREQDVDVLLDVTRRLLRAQSVQETAWVLEDPRLDRFDEDTLDVIAEEAALVVDRLRERTRLAAEARSEPLTGLANRRTFTDALRTAQPGDAVVMIDLDGFKSVNDRHGHPVGDEVLVAMADCLRRTCRERDCVSRFGGDEFAAVLHGCDEGDARRLVARLQEAWSDTEPLVGFSAGVGCCEADEDPFSALDRADADLYRAKRTGRGAVLLP
ncbi:MAG: GGDEF domain-containing protein [Acidimicrobiales bacterium]|nr:GGDEF domain-containing protein [Acidimicrobiales bacterium]